LRVREREAPLAGRAFFYLLMTGKKRACGESTPARPFYDPVKSWMILSSLFVHYGCFAVIIILFLKKERLRHIL